MPGNEVADLFATLGLKPKENEWKRGNELIQGLKKALAVVGVAVSAHLLKGMVDNTTELASHAVDVSQKLGVTAEAVQELGFAAGQTGTEAGTLEAAMGKLALTMDAAKQGGKEQRRAFRELGVSMKDLKGETLDQNLEVIANAFAKMPDGANKAALAMKIFGKSGGDLIPFLNEGQAGIVALREEAHQLGVVIDENTARSLEAFGDEQAKVAAGVQGLKNEFVKALLPALQSATGAFLSWFKANREAIGSGIRAFVDGLGVAFNALATIVSNTVVPVVQFFRDHTEALIPILVALGIAFSEMAVSAVAAWLAAAGPITLIALGIAAVIIVAKKFGGVFVKMGSAIKRAFVGAWDSIKRGVSDALSRLSSFVRDVGHFFAGVADAIAAPFIAMGSAIKQAFTDAFDWIVDKANWLWDHIPGPVKELLASAPSGGGMTGVFAGAGAAGPPSAAIVPRRPEGSIPVSQQTVSVHTEINIDAKHADAEKVTEIARDAFKENLRRELIHAQGVVD